jgi:N-methylhydantoinase B
MRFAAQGYGGGKPGAFGGFRTSLGTRPNPKLSLSFPACTRFTLDLPGGGGFFDPFDRDPEAVARDVAEGLVSVKAARSEYGVRVTRAGRLQGLTPERRGSS